VRPIASRDADLAICAILSVPLRRRLFLYLSSATEPVGRDEAAAALGVTRSVAAFHLDKLADAGVLVVEYRRPPGRTGPGAGRPAKLYRTVQGEVSFSVPERHYEVVAAVLARAVSEAEAESIPVAEAVRRSARALGRAMGAHLAESGGTTWKNVFEHVAAVLDQYGYQPRIEPGRVTLANCPYHALIAEYGDVICRMNLRLLKGVLKGAGANGLTARQDRPPPGQCCVTITAR
jgi:predicted ArsR family transcriptional regulator